VQELPPVEGDSDIRHVQLDSLVAYSSAHTLVVLHVQLPPTIDVGPQSLRQLHLHAFEGARHIHFVTGSRQRLIAISEVLDSLELVRMQVLKGLLILPCLFVLAKSIETSFYYTREGLCLEMRGDKILAH
jgi:hypothetical protein